MATIYKISCQDSEIKECYVGSTEDFSQRCRTHKSRCNNTNDAKHNYKLYKYVRANGGFDNFIIEQIIDCEIENRYDAELYYFKLLNPTLNTKFPKRSSKDYYIDNREQIREQHKQYYNDNKQQISKQQKQHYFDNKEHYQQYHKQYYNDNKQQKLEQNKQYYENNKQQILEQRKIKIDCDCGNKYTPNNKTRHLKSTKHQNYINSKL